MDPRGLSTRQPESPEDKAKIREERALYRECFSTPAGERVLEDLNRRFTRRIMRSETDIDYAYKGGQNDVVILINTLSTREESDDGMV